MRTDQEFDRLIEENYDLVQENERLRAALEQIAGTAVDPTTHAIGGNEMRRLARRVLGIPEEDDW